MVNQERRPGSSRAPGSFEKLFKRFKKEVEREKILQEFKSREFFEKPSRQRQLKRLRKARSR